MTNGYTDKELLDYLQQLTDEKKYTGKVVMHDSLCGRSWRLHETSGYSDSSNSIEGIDNGR